MCFWCFFVSGHGCSCLLVLFCEVQWFPFFLLSCELHQLLLLYCSVKYIGCSCLFYRVAFHPY
jgi:hypothetical protein